MLTPSEKSLKTHLINYIKNQITILWNDEKKYFTVLDHDYRTTRSSNNFVMNYMCINYTLRFSSYSQKYLLHLIQEYIAELLHEKQLLIYRSETRVNNAMFCIHFVKAWMFSPWPEHNEMHIMMDEKCLQSGIVSVSFSLRRGVYNKKYALFILQFLDNYELFDLCCNSEHNQFIILFRVITNQLILCECLHQHVGLNLDLVRQTSEYVNYPKSVIKKNVSG